MSAYIVPTETFRFLIAAAQLWELSWYYNGSRRYIHRVDEEAASKAGQMLVDANIRSVDFRYSETTDPAAYAYGQHRLAWNFRVDGPKLALQVLRTLDTYEYQACEPNDWRESEAYAFVNALRHAAIYNLEGYQEAHPDFSLLADAPQVVRIGGGS